MAAAQTVQTFWTVPDGSQSNFKQTFTNGETLPVSWQGWSSDWTNQYLSGVTIADLWVSSYNWDQYQYSEFLTGNVNITQSGMYNWNIDINSTSLSNTAEYVLRFKQPQPQYNSTSQEMSSPAFIVIQNATTPKATTTITTTTTTPSISTSIFPSVTSTKSSSIPVAPTSSQVPTDVTTQSSGLTVGAKAGIGVGVSLGAIAIIAILAFIFRHRFIGSSSEQSALPPEYNAESERSKQVYSLVAPSELPVPPAELDAEEHL